MEDGRVPGSTLVSSVKIKEGKDTGSNHPSAFKGRQSQRFESAECWWRMAEYQIRLWLVMLKERKVKTAVRIWLVPPLDVKRKEGKHSGSYTCATGYSISLRKDKAYI